MVVVIILLVYHTSYYLTTTTFWNLGLKNGIPQLVAPGITALAGATRIDDNNWHHVVGTFNFRTTTAALYVDGAPVANRTASLSSATFASVFMIGAAYNGSNAFKGTLDHVQLFGTDLAASTVTALYNRTLQQYCVASGAGAIGADIRWGKITVRENDLRGGRLTASAGLKMIVDDKGPEAQFTSHAGNAVVADDRVSGGTASDFTEVGVGKVEVSTDNGVTWQTATGANTWSFSLAGLSGLLRVRVRATDLVGNVGPSSGVVNVTVDTTARP